MFFIAPRKYSEKKSLSIIPSFKNNYLRTFLLSLAMSLFMVFSLYGLYGMIAERTIPIHAAIALLIFAVLFVVGYEFFNARFVRKTTALVVGFLAAFCLTILILALVEFAMMAFAGTITDIGWEKFVVAVAFCLIVSVIILKYFENL
ncbi:hypothetical protein MmiAt1_12870 [Methanimicrococcus sp. At1]|uniref:Heat-shock protein n=1 Tax=Methanimicrococcus hacksteinii TaxID=3028293 RepID=A0ABU3VQK3_9EURY|nr:hypothetical protein [Methanimicrococcus sp. At1]MDV0445693.1 hypothetical protein [Methanimicrococcus sp. At1]